MSKESFFSKKFGLLGKKLPTFTVVFANTIFIEGFSMFRSSISFITCPIIMREFFVKLLHILITISFSKDTCCGNRCINTIAFYDTTMRKSLILNKIISIDQKQLGLWL